MVVLMALHAIYAITVFALTAVAGLSGRRLAPDEGLATLPVTAFIVAGALSTFPMALFMARSGRRAGFLVGILVGIVGAAVSALALWTEQFALLCAGTFCLGIYGATGQYYRYAAAEIAPQEYRSRAISWVLASGLLGAFVGPESAKLAKGLLGPMFAGSYVMLCGVGVVGLLLTWALQLPARVDGKPAGPSGGLRVILRRLPVPARLAGDGVHAAALASIGARPVRVSRARAACLSGSTGRSTVRFLSPSWRRRRWST
jgi:MFS family permease